MKRRLWGFCAAAGLLLGSAAPPPAPKAVANAVAPAPVAAPVLAEVPEPPRDPERLIPAPAPAPAPPPPPPPPPEPVLPESRVKVVVSIPQQKIWVFRDGELWDSSPVSTGRRGHETPAGTFRILQKKVHHRSNLYDNAPMPYMQRLTWGGVALHAGRVPGYPASHGCIRLPRSFAKKLYRITDFATEVTVTHERIASTEEALLLA